MALVENDFIILPIILLVDGLGWVLASQYADSPRRFRTVGWLALLGGILLLAGYPIPEDSLLILRQITLAFGAALALATGFFRYFIWSENWGPVRVISRRLGAGINYDMPEILIVAVVWLVSSSSLGDQLYLSFHGLARFLWNIGGTISAVRLFDVPAAMGISSNLTVRFSLLWVSRAAILLAILVRVLGGAM